MNDLRRRFAPLGTAAHLQGWCGARARCTFGGSSGSSPSALPVGSIAIATPMARCALFYGGSRAYDVDGIEVRPLARALAELPELLGGA